MGNVTIYLDDGHVWWQLPESWTIHGVTVDFPAKRFSVIVEVDGHLYLCNYDMQGFDKPIPFELGSPELTIPQGETSCDRS